MHLSGVHLPLDDVEDRDVAVVVVLVTWGRNHHILGLKTVKCRQETKR